ncbi:hypothetical protein [Ruania alba]|uniref:Uncharacterized protein n=1 Tax=Ruania alba TaxID=648782 RepID=A0A1H5H4Z8_9MICO|nr:hypothetical protein [Ruania alba]SEE22288.1 hypothetical protein SAMN04488554_1838 [Ruania alba]
MTIRITYAELEEFQNNLGMLATNVEHERDYLERAAEEVGDPFGRSDLKHALEFFHEDWNMARDELVASLQTALEHTRAVATGWRDLDTSCAPEPVIAPPTTFIPE